MLGLLNSKYLERYYKLIPPRKEFRSVPSEETKKEIKKET